MTGTLEPGPLDDIIGTAISTAVRRAVDGVGRDPLADLPPPVEDPASSPSTSAPDAGPGPGPWSRRVEDPSPPPLPRPGESDPYELLGLPRQASWEEIIGAYRRRARAWHPDGAAPDELAGREELIRVLNMAYAELRVRRGR